MNIDGKTNIDVTPLLSNEVLAEVDTETKVENEGKNRVGSVRNPITITPIHIAINV